MIFIALAVVLFAVLIAYLRLADHFHIFDKPNERSSHRVIAIRGGGIVFPLSVLLWFAYSVITGQTAPEDAQWFVLGMLGVALISFVDDVRTISTVPRLSVHLISVGLLLYQLGFGNYMWYYWILGFILVIGWINAFNFMDGINGITALYSLSVILPVYLLNEEYRVIPDDLLGFLAVSVLVFSFFNVRRQARTFAGDVGSVSMAFVLGFLMIRMISGPAGWSAVVLVVFYGVDAVLTIVQRLLKGENIFQAHRSHLYQYLANERKWSHIAVSAGYAIVQSVVSYLWLQMEDGNRPIFAVSVAGLLVLIYFPFKRWASKPKHA